MKTIIIVLITILFLNTSTGCVSIRNEKNDEAIEPSETAPAVETVWSKDDIVAQFQSNFEQYSEIVTSLESIDLPYGITISRSEDTSRCYDLYGQTLQLESNEDYKIILEQMESLGVLELHMPQRGKVFLVMSFGIEQGSYIQGIMYAIDYEPASSMEEKIVEDWYWYSVPST